MIPARMSAPQTYVASGDKTVDLACIPTDLFGMTKAMKGEATKTTKAKAAAPTGLIARTAANALVTHQSRGNEALATIARNRAQIADSFFDIALELTVLRRPEIYGALGFAGFEEVIPTTGLSRATAYELLRLSERYTRGTVITLGPERGTALIRYVDATLADDDAETLAREDAEIDGTPISKLSAEQIEQAARDARAPSKTPRREGEGEAKKAVAGLKKRIAKSGAEVSLKRVKGAWVAVMVVPIEKVGLIKG